MAVDECKLSKMRLTVAFSVSTCSVFNIWPDIVTWHSAAEMIIHAGAGLFG